MPRKPGQEGVLVHNICPLSCRFSERQILARVCSENKIGNTEIVTDLINEKMNNKGVPLMCDRGYSSIDVMQACSSRNIPFLGTIQNRRLRGDYPILPKAQGEFYVK